MNESLIERLRDLAKKSKYRHSDADVAMTEAADALAAATVRLKECEKDAQRYRWLRERINNRDFWPAGAALDRHIDIADAALAQGKP